MTFDLTLEKGFKQPRLLTVTCTVDGTKNLGPRLRRGRWQLKKEHHYLVGLIAKVTSGGMYSFYSVGLGRPFLVCYNDNSEHHPASVNSDSATAFALDYAPMDDSAQFKHLRKGPLHILHPLNATMPGYEGRWGRWY